MSPKIQIYSSIVLVYQQMIDVLGGDHSEYYKKFQLVCRKSFMLIKHYFNSYYELLKPISIIDQQYTLLKIQNLK